MNYHYAFAIVMLLLGLSGCIKDSGNPDTFNCFFLTVGNEWTYDQSELAVHKVLKLKIESETDGVYRISRKLNFGVPTYQYWYTDGPYLRVYLEGETKEDSRIIFKCAANLGNSWESASLDVSGETNFYQVTGLNRTTNTFAGEFNTARVNVSFSYKADEQYQYWSDIYGLVFQEGDVSLELTSKIP